jgi:polyhydroxybutyrate depolymerase
MISRIRYFLLGLLVLAVFAILTWSFVINRTNGTLISSGERRSYLLYVPGSYDPSTPTPLVITIHGFAQWPAHQMHITRWNDLADEYGFIAVYPAGTRFPMRWRIVGEAGSSLDPMRDVTFISDLIDKLETEYNIDPSRIYANGLSNGGGMSFLLSCKMSDHIAAIGTVGGVFNLPWEDCQPSRPMPTMVFHGTEDPIVPYAGGKYRDTDFFFPAIPDWVAMLAQRNGCGSAPQELPASGLVSGFQYTGCTADVIFYTITGGGHTWPGGEPIPDWIAGYTSQDIDATRTLWEFFQSHPLPGRQ